MATKKTVRKRPGRAAKPSLPRRESDSVHTLKVSLLEVMPTIWRRVVVPSHFSLGQLHQILQVVMGWANGHLHQFQVGDEESIYSAPEFELGELDLGEVGDENSVTLAEVLPEGSFAIYEYDFGDGWEHLIDVESVGSGEPGVEAPLCLGGKRACPPEDCGGPPGYEGFLEAIRDPRHEEHEEMLDWVGGEFDPEAFDLQKVNRTLRRFR